MMLTKTFVAATIAIGAVSVFVFSNALAGKSTVAYVSGATVAGSAAIPSASINAISSALTSASINATSSAVTSDAGASMGAGMLPATRASNVTIPVSLRSFVTPLAPGQSVTFVCPNGCFTVTANSDGGFSVESTPIGGSCEGSTTYYGNEQ